MENAMGNPQGDRLNIILNAKLGDGGIYKCESAINSYMAFFSTSVDLLTLKRDLCHKYNPSNLKSAKSGYKQGNTSFRFDTRVHIDITNMYYMSNREAIDLLAKDDLLLWYLDDGTYHQRKHFMHLYCNMLSAEDAEYLADKIHQLYNIKRPSLRWDRKKDGRQYPYLYFPVPLASAIAEDLKGFLAEHGLSSMYYKIGESIPSTTIESYTPERKTLVENKASNDARSE